MKQLVKRMLRPYHLGVGCVEAYGDNDSDTTKVAEAENLKIVSMPGDSVRVTGVVKKSIIVNGDTISTKTDTLNIATSRKTFLSGKNVFKRKIDGAKWDGVIDEFNKFMEDS